MDESQISPNDAVGKVLGKEHSGRVRCLGEVVPSNVFKQVRPRFVGASASSSEGSCSSQCQENHNQMMNAHNQMMNAFKAYMIMKEGMIPEQFAGSLLLLRQILLQQLQVMLLVNQFRLCTQEDHAVVIVILAMTTIDYIVVNQFRLYS
ncbi:hypothetical protein H5410_014259 [Solanum commersonii]|uniref:Uncharacterized protein n=1 Tax=Solanum commersonii TaxID=4109 RepID=A0A9J5ZQQ4_SOLCO|nr:hypothetical protein H5410_014259 [Solanum commersonii]